MSIKEVVAKALTQRKIPGAALCLMFGGQSVTLLVGSADAQGSQPLAADDRFGWRSITKSLVGTAVLQLVDEHKVVLDDPISNYVSGVPHGNQVTVRELLAMRSGIGNYTASPTFTDALTADRGRSWTDQELLAIGYAMPFTFPPGTSYQYSNTNTVLLGVLLEKITSKPWFEAVDTQILHKLGLTSVVYPGSKPLAAPQAPPFLINHGRVETSAFLSFSGLSAAGGAAGSVGDLANWGRTLVAGTLLSPQLQEQRMNNPSDVRHSDPASPVYDAYGLAMGEIDNWWGHTGFALGYAGITMTDPKSLDTIAILVNATETDGEVPAEVYEQIRKLVNNVK